MIEVRLNNFVWEYDEQITLGTPGGFGSVFRGVDSEGNPVAIKRLNLRSVEVAHRELHVAEKLLNKKLSHVLPFLDFGQDANSDQYFTVMPIAEYDLHEYVKGNGRQEPEKTIRILKDIIEGLLEVPELVHRDLKPKNILYHEGRWKIADFGLARFIEESTSINTVMAGLSPQYAAPEQWNLEKASQATDVYAIGCIGYFLSTGTPPFSGPTKSDYKRQHLSEAPLALSNELPELRSLLSMTLRKAPESRPDLTRVKENLQRIPVLENGGRKNTAIPALARAGAAQAEKSLADEARKRQEMTTIMTRRAISDQGKEILIEVFRELVQRVRLSAPTATINDHNPLNGNISLGHGAIGWEVPRGFESIAEDSFPNSKWNNYCGAVINVVQRSPGSAVGYGSNLWYASRQSGSSCRWYEVSYMTLFNSSPVGYEPFELNDLKQADLAMSHVMHTYQRAFGPRTIDDEDSDEFLERWLTRFAEASEQRLQRPSRLPLD